MASQMLLWKRKKKRTNKQKPLLSSQGELSLCGEVLEYFIETKVKWPAQGYLTTVQWPELGARLSEEPLPWEPSPGSKLAGEASCSKASGSSRFPGPSQPLPSNWLSGTHLRRVGSISEHPGSSKLLSQTGREQRSICEELIGQLGSQGQGSQQENTKSGRLS